tara:strand:- start:247 stop:441 length:195 start_codon:yes stop_codon:yes gene_type:complete
MAARLAEDAPRLMRALTPISDGGTAPLRVVQLRTLVSADADGGGASMRRLQAADRALAVHAAAC